MKIAVIGTGYVGLVSGTCFSEIGHEVTCIDIDLEKVKKLKAGFSPIYEPGLNDLLERNIKSGRLQFSHTYESIKNAEAIFLAVQTPSSENGEADLTYFQKATEMLAKYLAKDSVVVIKSTVPVGTCHEVERWLKANTKNSFHVVNNPEFLKEGSAIDDFMRPDRVVVGHDSLRGRQVLEEIYQPLILQGRPIIYMSNLSAEMTKYAANCFLATKISFINEMARLCDLTGADIDEVRKGITSDVRIGTHFLYPGIGYGGSCFPKDVKALMNTAKKYDINLEIVRAADEVNNRQKTILFEKLSKHFNGQIKNRTFAFWGVSFKPNTDDVREAPAIYMAKKIIEHGGSVQFFDPVATHNFKNLMLQISQTHGESKIDLSKLVDFEDKYECLKNADALLLLTEWGPFRAPDFELIKQNLKTPLIFDGRNIYSPAMMQKKGIKYYAVGRRV
jgi:UDPglucose 6-dehydrogenase